MLAGNGLSPIGEKDELVLRLAKWLKEQNGGDGGVAGSSDSASAKPTTISPTQLIEDVTRLEDDHTALLSLSGVQVTNSSSTSTMRKAYLLLSRQIHPDKHGGSSDAKKAFQCLVIAFDTLSNPTAGEDMAMTKRRKVERVQRSNEGCFKTRINCPRCHIRWGDAILGLEKASYNFMMMAVKQYICGRCACLFGAMTADHFCPHCHKKFDYDPDDYHRKITCGNGNCKRPFGFWYFDCSERREKEVRLEAKEMQEKAARSRTQRQRRANRQSGRAPESSKPKTREQKLGEGEKLFLKGLIEVCPRCGISRADLPLAPVDGVPPARAHLNACTDQKKIRQYQEKLAQEEREKKNKLSKEAAQADAMMLKTWEMGGRQLGQLWMLNVRILKSQCEANNVKCGDTEDKTELIGRLAKHLRNKKTLLLTSGGHKGESEDVDIGYDTIGIAGADDSDLPSNFELMEEDELKAVCASYGIKFNAKKDRKSDLITKLEKERYKGNKEMTLMLTGRKANGDLLLKDSNPGQKRAADDEEWDGGERSFEEETPAEKPARKQVVLPMKKRECDTHDVIDLID